MIALGSPRCRARCRPALCRSAVEAEKTVSEWIRIDRKRRVDEEVVDETIKGLICQTSRVPSRPSCRPGELSVQCRGAEVIIDDPGDIVACRVQVTPALKMPELKVRAKTVELESSLI